MTAVSLDASFKQYEYTQGMDIASEVPFDAEGLVDQMLSTAIINETDGYATGNSTSFTYDEWSRVIARTDALGRVSTSDYDLNGNLVSFTDRKGLTTEVTYDVLNRPVRTQYADASAVSYTYDAAGRVVNINDTVGGAINFAYDNLSRLIRESSSLGSVSYTYDALGRRTSMSVAGQPAVNYTYDAGSILTDIDSAYGRFGFTHDAIGRRTSLTRPNGVTTSYTYDRASRLLRLVHEGPEGIIEDIAYGYDHNGSRTAEDRAGVDSLLPEPMTATYGAGNRMLTHNDETLEYDLNGNLIRKGELTFTWDARNRLVGITGPDLEASFTYDALNRRISKTVNGRTVRYVYDGADMVQEIEGGLVTANYLGSLNIDEHLVRAGYEGDVSYYLADALGSVIAFTDENATVVTKYNYSPFGKTQVIGSDSTGLAQPFRYTGREWDRDTGMYFYRARYYSPEMARFVKEDPLSSPLNVKLKDTCSMSAFVSLMAVTKNSNAYAYVTGNPVKYTDPFGLKKDEKEQKEGSAAGYVCAQYVSTMFRPEEGCEPRMVKSTDIMKQCDNCCLDIFMRGPVDNFFYDVATSILDTGKLVSYCQGTCHYAITGVKPTL